MNTCRVGYEPGKPILSNLSLRFDPDDRIALLGKNGNGKSTLAKLLAGKLDAMAGEMIRARKLVVGYFAQHQLEELDGAMTPHRNARKTAPQADGTGIAHAVSAASVSRPTRRRRRSASSRAANARD